MKKLNHYLLLRLGFGVFLVVWGFDRILRVDMWASESLMGYFYGSLGLISVFVIALGIMQLCIALSFFTNYQVKYSSLLLLAMFGVSTIITIVPLFTYLIHGGNPVPGILFIDHLPLLAGTWAIYENSKPSPNSISE